VYIYLKMGGKTKEKDFLVKWVGGISTRLSVRAAARATGPSWPANGRSVETTPRARAHVPARGRGKRRHGGWWSVHGEEEPTADGPMMVLRWWPGSRWSGWWHNTCRGRGSWQWGEFADGSSERANHSEEAGLKRR
jgi:hypothetical protein